MEYIVAITGAAALAYFAYDNRDWIRTEIQALKAKETDQRNNTRISFSPGPG